MSKEKIIEYFSDINYAYNDCTRWETLKNMLNELEDVVRCKDCRYYIEEVGACIRSDIIRSDMRIIMPDWFCADGVRKEQDNEQ